MKKLFLLLFSVLAFTSQVRADVEWTIWEGEINMSTTKGEWNNNLYLNNNNFKNLAKGDKLHLEFSKNEGVEGDAQIALDYQVEKVNKTSEEKTWPQTRFMDIYTSTSNCDIDITDDILGYLEDKDDGTYTYRFINIVIYGHDYTLTKVSIKKHFSVIKTTLSDDDVSLGSWANQYEVDKSALQGVAAGDYYYMPATRQLKDGNTDISFWQAQFYYDWTNLYNVSNVNHDVWAEIQSVDIDNIKANNLHVKGEYYNATGLYLLHPVNSFKIGSIGMATFSADQEVTVPEGLTAYKAAVSGNNVTLTPFTNNVIPAGKGAIIVGKEGAVVEFAATSTGSEEESALQPVTTATKVTSLPSGYDYYVLFNNKNDKEHELGLGDTDLNTKWDVNTTYESNIITFKNSWQGCGWYFGEDVDYSEYNRIVATFTTNKAGRLVVQYNDNTTSYTDYESSATTVTVEFDPTNKKHLKQIYFTCRDGEVTAENTCTITLGSAIIKGDKSEFRKTTSGTIAANKAYLKIPTSPGSKLNIVFAEDENKQDEEQQGETNSIRNIANNNVNNNVVYNMNGQRVGSDYKGLVIVNGKKIIKK